MNRREFLEVGARASLGVMIGSARAARGMARDRQVATREIQVVTLEGTARERGRMHGEALRAMIRETVEPWRASLSSRKGESVDQYLVRFARETSFADAITHHTPHLMDEIRGIAEGSGVPFETIFAMQLLDEEWCYATAEQFPESGAGDKCSVLALARDEHHATIVAQNLDGPDFLDRHIVVLRLKDAKQDLDALVVTMAGCIALNGMNARGLAVCVNALLTLKNARSGLPVACVIRGVLERKTLAEAAQFVQKVPHASGQCYTIGDVTQVECHEASAGKVTRALADSQAIAHTNHPLVNDNVSPLGKWVAMQPADAMPGMHNSRARLEACQARLASPGADAIASVKAALGSHDRPRDPVCRHLSPGSSFTAACTVYELHAGHPTLHLATTPPCRGEFREHSL
ncbi:MAG: C45 family peptidase [Planctomycetota bacterium]